MSLYTSLKEHYSSSALLFYSLSFATLYLLGLHISLCTQINEPLINVHVHKPAFFSSNNLDHLLLTGAAFCLSKTCNLGSDFSQDSEQVSYREVASRTVSCTSESRLASCPGLT
nr:hypothetical protein Iba_chr12bCG8610 [Ipomoea batatas]